MTLNLTSEYRGFIKFISRANHELIKWFGPHCDENPPRIAFMAAREWDGMADLERKPFIRSSRVDPSSVNPYFKYLLHTRYSGSDTFNPKHAKHHGRTWKSFSTEEKEEFSSLEYTDSGIDHVLEKRDELHRQYKPQELCLLEFITRTKPRWPASARLWYHRSECQGMKPEEAKQRWLSLDSEERGIYDRCAVIDRKRYEFEKNAWVTKILTVDLEDDNFTLDDFQIPEAKSRIDSLGSFVDLSRDLPSMIGLKRPRNPFSLFIEAYRYQIRDERPEFQFARHLRECSEAWQKLSDEERTNYIEESRRLKEKRRNLLAGEPAADSRLTIPVDLFSTTKSVYGPCRPSHLYTRIVPSPMSIWGKEQNIIHKNLKDRWDEVPQEVKDIYERKHQDLKEARERDKTQVERKLKYLKQLLKEATKLECYKEKLRLIGSSKKAVKNLYT